jgi:protease-4
MKSSNGPVKKLFVRLLATIGALTLVGVGIVVVVFVVLPMLRPVPKKVILEVDLEKPLVEYVPQNPLALAMMRGTLTVRDVVEALERASEDDRVVGLVARIGAPSSMSGMISQSEMTGLAVIQEIRDAVKAFGDKGKFTVAYAEAFGEAGPGNAAYYLATAFEEIYLQPSGFVGLTGLMYEQPFVRGTLDKLHVTPRVDHREEYKSAMYTLTETKYVDPDREATQKVMTSHFGQIMKGIVEARGVSQWEVSQLMDKAPLLGKEALEAGLIDGLLYRDQVYDEKVKAKAKDAKLLYLDKYLKRAGRPHKKGPTIALVYGVGPVHRGSSTYNLLFDSPTMGSDTVAAAFRAAVADDKVKAILFRVNSPGGSGVASDAIWREITKAREAGKPVIVSMGDVAGSGGYWVSAPATRIVAQPATITGSIGVISGKMLTRILAGEPRRHLGRGAHQRERYILGRHPRFLAPAVAEDAGHARLVLPDLRSEGCPGPTNGTGDRPVAGEGPHLDRRGCEEARAR